MDKETKEALPQQRIEKQLAELYLFMKRTNEYSEWWRESTLQQWVQELQQEVAEMKVELEKNDQEKFRQELGDVLWDVLALILKSEEKGIVNLEELLPEIQKKFKRRKHFVVEGKKVSKAEEAKIWEEVKRREAA